MSSPSSLHAVDKDQFFLNEPSDSVKAFLQIEKRAQRKPKTLEQILNNKLSSELKIQSPDLEFILYLFHRLKMVNLKEYNKQLNKLPVVYKKNLTPKNKDQYPLEFTNFLENFGRLVSTDDAMSLFLDSFDSINFQMGLLKLAEYSFYNNNPVTFIHFFEKHENYFNNLPPSNKEKPLRRYCQALRYTGEISKCLKKLPSPTTQSDKNWAYWERIATHLSSGHVTDAKKMLLTLTPSKKILCQYSPDKSQELLYFILSSQILRLEKKFEDSVHCLGKFQTQKAIPGPHFFKSLELTKTYRLISKDKALSTIRETYNILPRDKASPFLNYLRSIEEIQNEIFIRKNINTAATNKKINDLLEIANSSNFNNFKVLLKNIKAYTAKGKVPSPSKSESGMTLLELQLLFDENK